MDFKQTDDSINIWTSSVITKSYMMKGLFHTGAEREMRHPYTKKINKPVASLVINNR